MPAYFGDQWLQIASARRFPGWTGSSAGQVAPTIQPRTYCCRFRPLAPVEVPSVRGKRFRDFRPGGGTPATPAVDVKSLHAKIGELTLENEGALTKAGWLSSKRMIEAA
jgi:hypothetical protein